jgi:hypothetical protein
MRLSCFSCRAGNDRPDLKAAAARNRFSYGINRQGISPGKVSMGTGQEI